MADVPTICDSNSSSQYAPNQIILKFGIAPFCVNRKPNLLDIHSWTVVCMDIKGIGERCQYKILRGSSPGKSTRFHGNLHRSGYGIQICK